MGGNDDFSTEMLEWRLGVAKAINYKGDIQSPPCEFYCRFKQKFFIVICFFPTPNLI